ncbi:MAG: hypothetical protein HC933_11435 [Pleurocapsa sp. SU_196_0]|nr:hypothetical protein [Pleurocapsa sp. SU_196_0]
MFSVVASKSNNAEHDQKRGDDRAHGAKHSRLQGLPQEFQHWVTANGSSVDPLDQQLSRPFLERLAFLAFSLEKISGHRESGW